MKLSAHAAATVMAGLLSWVVIFLPVVSGNSTYLRNPQNPCALQTCQNDSECSSSSCGSWTCNLNTNMCEYAQCIDNAGRSCDEESNDVSLHCCDGWKCVDHPNPNVTGQRCIRNPNHCQKTPIPDDDPTLTCSNTDELKICCNQYVGWFSTCDGECNYGSHEAVMTEEWWDEWTDGFYSIATVITTKEEGD